MSSQSEISSLPQALSRRTLFPRMLLLLVATPFFLEVFLRVFVGSPKPQVWTPNLTLQREVPDLMDSSRMKKFVFKTNNFGVRGDQISAGEKAVLFLGSSTLECEGISNDTTWPEIMMKTLDKRLSRNYRCLNAGRSGMKLPQNILHFKALADQLHAAGTGVAFTLIMPGAMDLQSFLANPEVDSAFDASGGKAASERNKKLFEQAFPGISSFYDEGPFYKRNLTWLYLSRLKQQFFQAGNEPRKSLTYFQKRRIRSFSRRADLSPEKEARFQAFLKAYEANLHSLIQIGLDRNIPTVLVSQPILSAPSDTGRLNSGIIDANIEKVTEDSIRLGRSVFIAQDQYVEKMGEVNAVTERVGQECQKCAFIDLAKVLPVDKGLFYDTFHYSERGCLLAGRLLAMAVPDSILPVSSP